MDKAGGGEEREKDREFDAGNVRLSAAPASFTSNSEPAMLNFSPEDLRHDPGKRKLSIVSAQRSQLPPKKFRRHSRDGQKSVVMLKELVDDGQCWRKYGQKEILGAKYPREYYRCTYRDDLGCAATKMVQRVNEGNAYKITYRGHHTCRVRTALTSESIGMNEYWGTEELAAVNPFFPDQGGFVFSSHERETGNATSSSEIRQDGSAISSITVRKESNKPMSTVSMVSANNKTTRVSQNETTVDLSDSLNAADNLGVPKEHSGSKVRFSSSAECTLGRLLGAVQDVQVKKIGIYGNGGIGKTTVINAFFSDCVMKRSFDLVFWVNVSRCCSRRKIQNALVQQLSLNVPNVNSDDEFAVILSQALQSRKFVLFLDDVEEYMDLQKVGIPVPSQDNKYKIILTTRTVNVCHAMEVDRIIKADVLPGKDALQLFRAHVGVVMDSQEINPYARAIVEECCGLPLTIKIVGRALRMEDNVLTWKLALKEVLLTNHFSVLKLGYDRLKTHDMKSCFLYSALFTQGKGIRHSSLVDYLIEEDCVSGSMCDARRRGCDIVKYLVDASLLESSDDGLMVKMHDTIRDLALMILLADAEGLQLLLSRYFRPIQAAKPTFEQPEISERAKLSLSEGNPSFLTATEGFSEELPQEREWEESRIACFVDTSFSSLPKSPPCSKLVTLFLQRNSSLRAIPPSFFENMSSLQVLNLSKTRIKSLPHSLSKLEHLQVFILRNCERLLFLPPVIGALKRLLVLDVHGTEICQLPDEIGELRSLTHLNVNFYGTIDEDEYVMLPSRLISKGVIANLNEVRELNIIVHPGDPRWAKAASDVMMEVSSLKLCALSFHFPEINHLEYFINKSPTWAHRTLTRFNFVVGHDVMRVVSHVTDDLEHEYELQDRCIRFVDGDDTPEAVGEVLSEATAFYLDHHQRARSLTQFGCANISKLKFCIVRDCPRLRVIINGKKLKGSCFPFLEHLSIHYSWDLRRICVGPFRATSFSMLRRLLVHSCPRLEYVLSYSMIETLSNLEELVVDDCQSLKNIVVNQDDNYIDDDINGSDYTESDYEDTSGHMEVVVPSGSEVLKVKVLKLHYLPKLDNIWNGGKWSALEYLSLYNCPNLRNLHLKSDVDVTLKEVKTETAWWLALEWEDPGLRKKLQGRVKEINVNDIWGWT